jgi:hypothetical protein
MPVPGENIDTVQKEYSIKRISKELIPDVAKLHEAVYGKPAGPDHFPRKFDTGYTGVEYVGFIAHNNDGIPVAYYGVLPCFIQEGEKTILAAQSADTMTHPQHRYKDMFVELSKMTFELCRELGILLIFGFPNQNSYHGAVKRLGWKMTGSMCCFSIPVKSLPLESLTARSRIFRSFYDRYSGSIWNKIKLAQQGIANSVLADGFAGVVRSNEYLQYKDFSATRIIKVADAKIWISNRPGMLIGDMEGITEKNFADVMLRLKKIAKKLGKRKIQFHICPGTSLHKLFAAAYEEAPSYPVLFQDFGSTIAPEQIKFSFADIDIF